MNVGILGVGTIGQILGAALDEGRLEARLVAICDQDEAKATTFAASLSSRPALVSMDELLRLSDLVVEAASQAALSSFIPRSIQCRRDMLIMSVGGLLGHDDWFQQAHENGCQIYIPSGAIAGLDGIKSAAVGRIDSALLTSRKPVAALIGTKYVRESGLRMDALAAETVIFDGTAEEAARAFPSTSNVAASLRLAVGASPMVRVRVVAVPGGKRNVHEICVEGEFGRMTVNVENVPSRNNPRTSQLAAFAALATLADITSSLHVGT